MVFQSCALFPHMTVAENMGFALKMAGVDKLGRVSAKVGAGHDRIEAGQAVGLLPGAIWALRFGADSRLAA